MTDQPNVLRVFPNPYAAFDHKGRPSAAVLLDPVEHRNYGMDDHAGKKWEQREFVGAKRTITVLQKGKTITLRAKRGAPPIVKTFPSKTDQTWEHSRDPVTLPNTKYYQRMVQSHQLFAADKASWVAAGGDPALYQDPMTKLAHAKEGAIASFIAHYGADDPRLQALAAHWDGFVAQTHPLFAPKAASKSAPASPAASTTTSSTKGS